MTMYLLCKAYTLISIALLAVGCSCNQDTSAIESLQATSEQALQTALQAQQTAQQAFTIAQQAQQLANQIKQHDTQRVTH